MRKKNENEKNFRIATAKKSDFETWQEFYVNEILRSLKSCVYATDET